MLKNEGDRLERIIVCSPRTEYFDIENTAEHNILEVADKATAIKQHEKLRTVIENFGAEVINIDEMPGHPNSAFTRDTAISTPDGYIRVRMGIGTRRGEEDWMAKFLDKMGEPCAGEIKEPGTVEGGDVILAGSAAFVGMTKRTNPYGVNQLSDILQRMGFEVRAIVLPDNYLHLDQVIGVLGPKQLICCKDLFHQEFFGGFDVIHVNCSCNNVNLICLGENEIIAPKSNRELIWRTRDAGVYVHEIELSEFAKGAGGPNCLILPVKRECQI